MNKTLLKETNASKKLAEKYANVYIINAAAYIPENFKINGLPVYSDRDHINPYGGRELAKRFLKTHASSVSHSHHPMKFATISSL